MIKPGLASNFKKKKKNPYSTLFLIGPSKTQPIRVGLGQVEYPHVEQKLISLTWTAKVNHREKSTVIVNIQSKSTLVNDLVNILVNDDVS